MGFDITAKDVMSSPVKTFTMETSVEDAVQALIDLKISGAPVVDHQGRIIGLVSEYDLIVALGTGHTKTKMRDLPRSIPIFKKVETIMPGEPIEKVMVKFLRSHLRRFPVINGKAELVGIVARRDILLHMMAFYRERGTTLKPDETP